MLPNTKDLFDYLRLSGFTGALNDMWNTHLTAQGRTGSLTDKIAQEYNDKTYGPELTPNTAFSNGLSGWAVRTVCTLANVGGMLQISNTGVNATVISNIKTKVGKTYTMTMITSTGNQATLYTTGNSNGSGAYASVNCIAGGQVSVNTFVATTETTYLVLMSVGAGSTTALIDSISIKEVL